MTLEEIKKYFENIQAAWSGEESGVQEDRAGIAKEIVELIEELEEI